MEMIRNFSCYDYLFAIVIITIKVNSSIIKTFIVGGRKHVMKSSSTIATHGTLQACDSQITTAYVFVMVYLVWQYLFNGNRNYIITNKVSYERL